MCKAARALFFLGAFALLRAAAAPDVQTMNEQKPSACALRLRRMGRASASAATACRGRCWLCMSATACFVWQDALWPTCRATGEMCCCLCSDCCPPEDPERQE